jgi:hypothetical protein
LSAQTEQGAGAQAPQAEWDELEYRRTSDRYRLVVEFTKEILQARPDHGA